MVEYKFDRETTMDVRIYLSFLAALATAGLIFFPALLMVPSA